MTEECHIVEVIAVYHNRLTDLFNVWCAHDHKFERALDVLNVELKRMTDELSYELSPAKHGECLHNITIRRRDKVESRLGLLEYLTGAQPKSSEIYHLDIDNKKLIVYTNTPEQMELSRQHHNHLLACAREDQTSKRERKFIDTLRDEFHRKVCDTRKQRNNLRVRLEKLISETYALIKTEEHKENYIITLLQVLVEYTYVIQYETDVYHFDMVTRKLDTVYVSPDYDIPPYAQHLAEFRQTLAQNTIHAMDTSILQQATDLCPTPVENYQVIKSEPKDLTTMDVCEMDIPRDTCSCGTSSGNPHDKTGPCMVCEKMCEYIGKLIDACRIQRNQEVFLLNARVGKLDQMNKNPTYHYTEEQHVKDIKNILECTYKKNVAEQKLYTALRAQATGNRKFWVSVLCPYHTCFLLKRDQYTEKRYEKELADRNKLLYTSKGEKRMKNIRDKLTLEFNKYTSDVYFERKRAIKRDDNNIYRLHRALESARVMFDELKILRREAIFLDSFVDYLLLIDPKVTKWMWHLNLSSMKLVRIRVTPEYNLKSTSEAYTIRSTEIRQTLNRAK
jgi:hypothetical protein